MDRERAAQHGVRHLGTLKGITEPKVLYLSAIYFIYQAGSLGVGYWLPQIIKGFSAVLTNTEIGLIATLPYVAATIGMVLWSHRSDRLGERKIHAALPLLGAGITLGAVALAGNPVIAIVLISASLTGLYAFKSPFWALPGLFLDRSTAAVSIAAINSIGNLGGFAGPYMVGLVKGEAHSPLAGLFFLAALVLVAAAMTWAMRFEDAIR
jgi:ACS family tartrate transporter-like MFS transporter